MPQVEVTVVTLIKAIILKPDQGTPTLVAFLIRISITC